MVGIYLITNLITQQKYVGQSINIEKRFKQHINRSHNSSSVDYDKLLYQDFRNFGIENFSFNVIEECDASQLDEKEKFYISFYNCLFPNGYNKTIGGSGQTSGIKLSKNQIQQLVKDLKDNLDLSVKDLTLKYNISHQMIYDINNGKSWFQDSEKYPLRSLQKEIKIYNCIDCGQEISKGSTRCPKCAAKENGRVQQKVERPEPFDLLELVAKNGFVAVGQKYGVSDKAIVKWCVSYNLPSKKKDIVDYYNKINNIIMPTKRKTTITKSVNKNSGKKLLQIDKNTLETIAIFDSCVAAAISLGNRDYNKHISSVASGSRKTAYGYIWKYEE